MTMKFVCDRCGNDRDVVRFDRHIDREEHMHVTGQVDLCGNCRVKLYRFVAGEDLSHPRNGAKTSCGCWHDASCGGHIEGIVECPVHGVTHYVEMNVAEPRAGQWIFEPKEQL